MTYNREEFGITECGGFGDSYTEGKFLEYAAFIRSVRN